MDVHASLRDKLDNLPTRPGVYRYLDRDGNTLYVGKAKSLRSRVRSYFRPSANHAPHIERMLADVVDLDLIVVDTEMEALILEAGGFTGIKPDAEKHLTSDLAYWQLKGGTTPSRIDAFTKRRKQKDIPTLIAEAEKGLHQLITAFALEDTPYLSHPNPAESGWDDYDHLARVKEWEAQRHDK
jgi:excinuclease UvrABC nuclease subunit